MSHSLIEEARAILALFARSNRRDLHVRTGGYEMFFALPGGAANPMLRAAPATETCEPVQAPHLGLFFAALAAGALVEPDTVIGQIEVLGEREDVVAGLAGRLEAMLVADGVLVEYAQPLARIAA